MLRLTFPEQTPAQARQIWLRIKVAAAAYAYEYDSAPIMSDGSFDALCKEVDVTISTSYGTRDNSLIDKWFRDHFAAHTGQWVHRHPHRTALAAIAQRHREELSK